MFMSCPVARPIPRKVDDGNVRYILFIMSHALGAFDPIQETEDE